MITPGARSKPGGDAQRIRTLEIKYRSSKSTLLQINTGSAFDSLTENAP